MRLVNTEVGRAVRIVPLEEIRPHSNTHLPTALRMIAERYSFAYVPDLQKPYEKIQQEGLVFQLGKMVHGNKAINITDFKLFNDGIVSTASSTEDADLFLEDIFAWGKEAFGFREVQRSRTRTLYLSTAIVDFDSSPDLLLTQFRFLSGSLSKLLNITYGIDFSVQISAFGLNFDKTLAPPAWQSLSQFILERRLNQPYSLNRFYSEAPLRTKDHLEFLASIDALLSADGRMSEKKPK